MDLTRAEWRKSTRSGDNGGDCVEVARNLPGIVAVRDSKNSDGPVLIVSSDAWARFIKAASRDLIMKVAEDRWT